MADFITITGVAPYDGRYEFDITAQPLTTREWGWVKRHAGYLPLTMDTSSFADPEFVIVEAVIAVYRAGRLDAADVPNLVERFQDVDPFSTITYERGEEEADADPPPPSSDAKPSSNGDSSPNGSETSADPLSPTGHPASDTSTSPPAMSVT